jgi:hypothetical protein
LIIHHELLFGEDGAAHLRTILITIASFLCSSNHNSQTHDQGVKARDLSKALAAQKTAAGVSMTNQHSSCISSCMPIEPAN